ncbi:MAG: hypothetical protein ABIO94_13985 [Opitutaceae bacterium]
MYLEKLPLDRRRFLKSTGVTGAGLLFLPSGTLFGAARPGIVASFGAQISAAESDPKFKGRVNHSVCKSVYPKASLDDLCQAAKEIGITSIDLMPPLHWPTFKKYGLTCGMAKIR